MDQNQLNYKHTVSFCDLSFVTIQWSFSTYKVWSETLLAFITKVVYDMVQSVIKPGICHPQADMTCM